MNWLHALYEVIGVPYPRLSIILAAATGAIVFGGGWWLIGKQYAKDHAVVSAQVVSKAAVERKHPISYRS